MPGDIYGEKRRQESHQEREKGPFPKSLENEHVWAPSAPPQVTFVFVPVQVLLHLCIKFLHIHLNFLEQGSVATGVIVGNPPKWWWRHAAVSTKLGLLTPFFLPNGAGGVRRMLGDIYGEKTRCGRH